MPAAVVVVLAVDPLHDEGVAYAERLGQAGVPVELVEFGHLTHGFLGFASLVPAAAEAAKVVVERLNGLLARLAVDA